MRVAVRSRRGAMRVLNRRAVLRVAGSGAVALAAARSEEHTSELQSQSNLVCRLLLEKKKNIHRTIACLRASALPARRRLPYLTRTASPRRNALPPHLDSVYRHLATSPTLTLLNTHS